jgi:hypothetical protein
MTEAEWLACTDPRPMLEFLEGKASERKLRLVACACCRGLWPLLTDERSRRAVEVSERYADGEATSGEMLAASAAADTAAADIAAWAAARAAAGDAAWAARAAATVATSDAALVALLREVFGNPFRPMAVDPCWLAWQGGTVPRLAQAAYAERQLPSGHLDPARLAVLADALEDAGCQDADLLGHLRGPGPHVRGCWVVDSLLDMRSPGMRCRQVSRWIGPRLNDQTLSTAVPPPCVRWWRSWIKACPNGGS